MILLVGLPALNFAKCNVVKSLAACILNSSPDEFLFSLSSIENLMLLYDQFLLLKLDVVLNLDSKMN